MKPAIQPLQRILRSGHCYQTHQRLAVDAIPLVQTAAGKRLASWFLRYHRRYLRGAIDPDIRFRDYHNHVIHVRDGYWGGAPRVAHQWYHRLQRYLRERRYSDAAHAAGVLSHYFTDPMQPFNTAHSSSEEVIHRPLAWSVQRAYPSIFKQWRDDDLRVVFQLADRPGWLGAAMLHGARFAHRHFETLVDLYRLDAAMVDPPAGIDSRLRDILAELFGLAITGWARVIERAASDAEAVTRCQLPQASLIWPTLTATAATPAAFWGNRVRSRIDDACVEDLVSEFRLTGKLEEHLPPEVDIKKRVLKVYRDERRYRLNRLRRRRRAEQTISQSRGAMHDKTFLPAILSQPVEKLGLDSNDLERLQSIGIKTWNDLLAANSAETAREIQAYWITVETIERWQRQARLMHEVGGLLPASAIEMLVGAGFRDLQHVVSRGEAIVHQQVVAYAVSTRGRRSRQASSVPTRRQVSHWIQQIRSCLDHRQDRQRKAA